MRSIQRKEDMKMKELKKLYLLCYAFSREAQGVEAGFHDYEEALKAADALRIQEQLMRVKANSGNWHVASLTYSSDGDVKDTKIFDTADEFLTYHFREDK